VCLWGFDGLGCCCVQGRTNETKERSLWILQNLPQFWVSLFWETSMHINSILNDIQFIFLTGNQIKLCYMTLKWHVAGGMTHEWANAEQSWLTDSKVNIVIDFINEMAHHGFCHKPSQPLSQLYPTLGQPCPDIANPGDTFPQWTLHSCISIAMIPYPSITTFCYLVTLLSLVLSFPLFLYSLSFPRLPCTLILGI